MTPVAETTPILFFDGVCGLCNRFVDFVLKHDRHGRVCMAPLQGSTAEASLPDEIVRGLDTVVLLDGELWHIASSFHPWENYMYTCDLNTARTYRATTSEPAEYEMEGWVRVDHATTGVTIEERSASELW